MSAQHTDLAAEAASPEPNVRSSAASPVDAQPADAYLSDTVAEQIEAALLGGPRRYSRCEVAEAVGADPAWCRRIWLALGFANVDDDARVFTDQDVEAVRAFNGLVAAGKIAPEEEVAHVRAIGQAMSRLADWQVREIVTRVGEAAGSDEMARTTLAAQMSDELLPVVEELQSYTWRRHLVAAVARILPASSEQLSTATVSVGFADIVGYTSTVRHTRINELALLLESFEENAAETVVSNHGRVVKSLGDEVLFVADTARDAAEIGVRLAQWGRDARDLPQLRVGIALGQVLTRLGDVYGPAVNVASRLTSLAKPGTVLVDKELAQALTGERAYRLHARRPAAVRGYHHLRSWSLRPAS
ncbi:MAG TPA: adenylate/guanylate cyclase domain-containing protein [Streptosporangiaceae bacterium]|jgi:adenylate cyclase|nr:adenylate/guanylate cyclase domain-containing protein [Streptosporangiaceae bacterium]